MREEKIAAEKRMVGGDEEEDEADDGGCIGIGDQIKEMILSPPPAPVVDVVVNSPFAKAADTTAELLILLQRLVIPIQLHHHFYHTR